MASYRPLYPPPQSNVPPPPPNQNILPPPPPRGGLNWHASNPNFAQNPNPNPNYQSSQQSYRPMPPQQQPLQHQPPPMYYQSSSSQNLQFHQHNQNRRLNQTQPPPPPPPSVPPPPPSSPPPPSPPPLPSSPPPLPPAKKDHSKKPPMPSSGNKRNERRTETEEERRLRKKREYEKMKQEERLKQQKSKESQNKVLEKPAKGGHGSIMGSQRMGDKRSGSSVPLLSGDRVENRLKKPTTFIGKLKFHNELPDPSAKIKLMALKRDPDRYCKYRITSLEKAWKPELYVEPNLGIPLDLLDLSVYNPPSGPITLDPKDEELLRDDEPITPINTNGIKRKDRPTDKGVSWLVKTQYISPISMESTNQSLTEKQARELREARDKGLLENLNDRDSQIKGILASFEACKSKPVHATNPQLQPRRVLPLLPHFDRYDDQFVLANFDSAPTGDSEIYRKLSAADRDEHEKRAIMRSYGSSSSNAENRDKFLAYMVPSVNELDKDMYDENEDISYSWVREYHWDVRGDNVDDPNTYLVTFGESEASYLPLPTKLMLKKKRARQGKSTDEIEHFAVPKKVTVRKRPNVSAMEITEDEDYAARGRNDGSGGSRLRRNVQLQDDNDADDNLSEAEDHMSE